MERSVIRLQGALELGGFVLFVIGFFAKMQGVMIVGGVLLVLHDVLAVLSGALNPLIPTLLAIALAVVIRPWYVGVFWSVAGLSVLNVPTNLTKVFAPERILAKIARRRGETTD